MASVSTARKPSAVGDDEWVDVAPPTPVSTVDDEWVDADQWVDAAPTSASVGLSVADTARARLSRRGLTPELVKQGTTTGPRDPSLKHKSRTVDGGYLSNLGSSLDPREIAAGMADRGLNWMLNVMDPTGGPDSLPPDQQSNRGVDMTDLGAPDLPAIYQEATRRGEQGESLAGMYGSATGQVLLAGGGALTSKLIRGAPARAAAAEAQYAEATGATPPVAREMLDRRMVIGADPTPQAAAQRTAAASINAERSAIPVSKPVRGSRGRFEPSTDPTDIANSARRADLKSQAQMESDIAAILEATPETRTALGAVGKGAGRFAKSRLTLASGLLGAGAGWSPASLVSLGPVAVTHLLWSVSKELVKTNQWRTAAPIYKMRFANALMTGNADLAATAGALIANGQATTAVPPTAPNAASPNVELFRSPIVRARRELSGTGITSEQAGAYRPTTSELLYKGIDPATTSYDTPSSTLRAVSRLPAALIGNELERTTPTPDPASEDAWALYLGLPQRHGSFDVSEFRPSKARADVPYYYKLKDPPIVVQDSADKDEEIVDSSEPTGRNTIERLVRTIDANGGQARVNNSWALGNFTWTKGQDRQGHYLAYYDKWDLAPAAFGVKLKVDKWVGKPLEIYDRIYYDPTTFKPKRP